MGVLHDLPPPPVSTKGIKPDAIPQLKQMVVKMMGWEKGPAFFPGSQPVSFEAKHLRTLLTERYFACEKTDGTRYMCLICKWGACLICREFKFYPLQCSFPSRDGGMLDQTLLDGELVYDKSADGSVDEWRYYIYDMMVLQGRCVMDDPLYVRLKHVKNHILAPRERAPSKEKEQIKIVAKEMYEVRHLRQVFDDIIPTLPHHNDGIIFTKVFSPYLCGTDNTLLKWKPAELNTVDFTLETIWGGPPGQKEPRFMLCCANRGSPCRFAFINLPPDQFERFRSDSRLASKAVLECVFDAEWPSFALREGVNIREVGDWERDVDWHKGGWKYLRIRDDKTTANDVSVIEKIRRSMADNVSRDALLEVAATLATHHAKVREEYEAARLLRVRRAAPGALALGLGCGERPAKRPRAEPGAGLRGLLNESEAAPALPPAASSSSSSSAAAAPSPPPPALAGPAAAPAAPAAVLGAAALPLPGGPYGAPGGPASSYNPASMLDYDEG
eukprot:tig00021318_g20143.t1